MQKKIWNYHKRLPDSELRNLSERFKIPPVIVTILSNRNINTELAVKNYFTKPMSGIHNPMLMDGMEKAAGRIIEAVDNNEKIVIYGDYDVDGITSTALLYLFLKERGADVSYYIPDRIGEGYGVNIMALNRFKKDGVSLVITVDCGITAVGEVEFAKLSGMDIIITDHHTCKEKLPNAYAVVNAKKPGCEYPFKELSGAGVAFKLILAAAVLLGLNTKEYFKKYCDIAAIGTIADVVPLTDENRIIVDKGLAMLDNTCREGIKAIFGVSGVSGKPITSSAISYAVSPRLNAAGRMGNAAMAVELLTETDAVRAYEIASDLDRTNRERQMTEQEIFNEAVDMLKEDKDFEKKKVIVLASDKWHNGVIGIVASRITDRFCKPCILITCENKTGKGSGRSIDGFNIFDALTAVGDDLIEFGGHAAAAGLSIDTGNIDKFAADINKYADKLMKNEDMRPRIMIDTNIAHEDITAENAKILLCLEPYGMGNPRPVFSAMGLKIIFISTMGIDNKHIRIRFLTRNNNVVSAVGFSMGGYINDFAADDIVDAAFTMEINEFQGNKTLQLQLRDIRPHE